MPEGTLKPPYTCIIGLWTGKKENKKKTELTD